MTTRRSPSLRLFWQEIFEIGRILKLFKLDDLLPIEAGAAGASVLERQLDFMRVGSEFRAMETKLIADALFGTRWHRATIALSSGELLTVKHVDSVMMPPTRSWLLVAQRKEGRDVPRIIAPEHVVSIETDPEPARATKG